MRRSVVLAMALALVLVAVDTGLVRGQTPTQSSPRTPLQPRGAGGATSVISPVVVAQWFTHRTTGVEQLELLVLWRGTPGWFLHPGGVSQSNVGSGSPGFSSITYGNVTLSLSFDTAKDVVTVQGKELPLSGNNVIFVEDVDGPSGPRVTGIMAVSPIRSGSSGQIAALLRGQPRIMAFLSCDAGNASPQRAQLEPLCMQNVGAVR